MIETKQSPRFLIVSIVPFRKSDQEILGSLEELVALVETYGGEIVDVALQNRELHDKGRYIGMGKAEEVALRIASKNIDVVVFNSIIKPGQIYEFQTIFEKKRAGIKVWDKIDFILKIFSLHANTKEAKLQIELAAMYHMGPRIYGMGYELSRQGGMLGTRGIGETNTERMKRHWREQIKKVSQDIEKLSKNRLIQLESRRDAELQTVSLVGYTNAGKTSLFNKLTGKKKLVRNSLFVTLDTTVSRYYLKSQSRDILISDTIGFMKDLPPQLIKAFESTLMESVFADVLLNVIDVSDENIESKIEAVEHILETLNLNNKKQIYVFNKIDKVKNLDKNKLIKKYKNFNPLFISTKTGEGIDQLVQMIGKII